jgi:TM2 domain-containing membrane protein YozV
MFCQACGKPVPDDAVVCVGCGCQVRPLQSSAPPAYPGPALSPAESDFRGKKTAAGICGILLGSLGIHKFILGLTTPGIIMLLVTVLTCGVGALAMHAIGLVEGIIYLTKNDADFYRIYGLERRGWF